MPAEPDHEPLREDEIVLQRGPASARSPTATGPLLCSAAAGTGKTEVLARRLARLAERGDRPRAGPADRLDPGRGAAPARARRGAARRAPTRSSGSAPGRRSASGCCASTPPRPGLDPFFEVVGPAERLAMLLDRARGAAAAPPRDPRQPGRPAGPAAGRIDALKAEAVGPSELAALAAGAPQRGRRRGRPRGRPARARVRRALRRPRPDPRRRRQPRLRRRHPGPAPAARRARRRPPRDRRPLPLT